MATIKNNLPGLVLGVLAGAGGASLVPQEPPEKVVVEVPREPSIVENIAKTVCIEGAKRELKSQEEAEKECSGAPKPTQMVIANQAIKDTQGRPYLAQEAMEDAIRKSKYESRRRDDDRFNEESDAAKAAGRMPLRPGAFLSGGSNPPGGVPPELAKQPPRSTGPER